MRSLLIGWKQALQRLAAACREAVVVVDKPDRTSEILAQGLPSPWRLGWSARQRRPAAVAAADAAFAVDEAAVCAVAV